MLFKMNVYYDANSCLREMPTITEDVFNRMQTNDRQDLLDAIGIIENEDEFDAIENFINTSTLEELKPYITVNESNVVFDKNESYECNYELLAYLVEVDFDIEKLLSHVSEYSSLKEVDV